jgi:pyruvate dehydrogenase E2 component (dihydrolipoamide acetyltransferase)
MSTEIKSLAERARAKKLKPEEFAGGVATVSNLGMYGVREFCAIINPPESGILAVGRIEKRPVVVEKDGHDEVVVQRRMTMTLSCDHRIMDGALGAMLLAEVVRGLEHPMLLVL